MNLRNHDAISQISTVVSPINDDDYKIDLEKKIVSYIIPRVWLAHAFLYQLPEVWDDF